MKKTHVIVLAASAGALILIGVATAAIMMLQTTAGQSTTSTIRDAVQPPDSGVIACEALRDSIEESEEDSGTADVFTEDEYLEVREMFADSNHEAIRDNGTTLIDLAWQMEQMTDENGEVGLEAMGLVSPFMEAYSGLSGGCAEQGIVIPPLEFDEN